MRVILYNPRSSAGRKPIVPLALLALGAVLDRDWQIVDGNLDDDPLATLDALVGEAPDRTVLGVTLMPGPQLRDAIPLCRALKARHPGLTVVWGGYFPTQHWQACVRAGFVDFVVRGHGEHGFVALLDALPGDPGPIPGLARLVDGEAVSVPLGPVPRPTDLPPLPLDRLDLGAYARPTFLGRRTLGYHSSYGCPYTCNFCAVVNMVNGRWFPQPAAQVADVVGYYVNRWGADAVELYDNNFFVNERRTTDFAQRIQRFGISWWGEGRVDTLLRYDDATWRRMAQSGLRMVFMGAESGSADTLARMDKGGTLTPEMTLELVGRMAGHGVVPELSFVLGSPPDPEADIEGTLDFVRTVKRVNPRTEIVLYLYTPEPLAGELLDAAEDTGFAFPDSLEEWASSDWGEISQRRSTLPWVRPATLRRLRGFERVLNAYYPTSTDARLRGPLRLGLRAVAGWRWHLRVYRAPVELSLLQRAVRYRRPETSGF